MPETSRPPARTRGLKLENALSALGFRVASSREDAWIETLLQKQNRVLAESRPPARTRGLKLCCRNKTASLPSRVLPRGRVD